MRELDECLNIRREITATAEKIAELKSKAYTAKNQVITDMPRGGSQENAIEQYIIKSERLKEKKSNLEKELLQKWQIIENYNLSGQFERVLKIRFFYGLSWKRCAKVLEMNENKVFRIYRKAITEIYKKI